AQFLQRGHALFADRALEISELDHRHRRALRPQLRIVARGQLDAGRLRGTQIDGDIRLTREALEQPLERKTGPFPYQGNLNVLLRTFLRSEEHTSELQSRGHLVCRLLLEKKNHAL